MIKIKEIEKLAELSRIEISDEEKRIFLKDIDSILGYVDQIKMAAGTLAAREDDGLKNVFREDVNPHDSGQFTEDLLTVAPEKENDCIKVKKIL